MILKLFGPLLEGDNGTLRDWFFIEHDQEMHHLDCPGVRPGWCLQQTTARGCIEHRPSLSAPERPSKSRSERASLCDFQHYWKLERPLLGRDRNERDDRDQMGTGEGMHHLVLSAVRRWWRQGGLEKAYLHRTIVQNSLSAPDLRSKSCAP